MKNFIKKSIMMVIIGIILICTLSAKSVFADIIDLSDNDEFSIIGESDDSTKNDNTKNNTTNDNEKNTNSGNSISKETIEKSSSKSNEPTLPETGSNVELIFAVGIVVLMVGTVFVYKKSKVKLD